MIKYISTILSYNKNIENCILRYIVNNYPADVVSKHWSYPQVWHLLKPLLFYSGNTSDLIDEDEKVEAKQQILNGPLESL